MQDPERRNTDKIQGDGEIHIPSARERRAERPHGKLYLWFDNFWYHHKWKTLGSLFLAVVILVCTLQMCQKESSGDIMVLMAGPYNLSQDQTAYNDLRACLARYLPADYDENGKKQVDIDPHAIYSAEQIETLKNSKDEAGNPIIINTAANSQNYEHYNRRMMLGESSVVFLDPWLYEQLAGNKNGEYLMDIVETFGAEPVGATSYEKDGKTRVYGVRLGDTVLYQSNKAISNVLPEDTMLCLLAPYLMSSSNDPEVYQNAKSFYAALVGLT